MSRPSLSRWLLTIALLTPAPALAQSPGPSYAPIELTADDLGVWDVVMTARGPAGVMTVRGTETNTIGCDGRCIVTKAGGELKSATQSRPMSAPWWRDIEGGGRTNTTAAQTGLVVETPGPRTSQVADEGPGLPIRPLQPRTMLRSTGPVTLRLSVEYPDVDRRIVTSYTIAPDGKETQAARIVYTRRK